MERWLDGERERERGRRKIDSVRVGRFSPASIRREIEGVCTRVHTLPRACVRAACTDADRPLCSIGAGGLAKMAVSEARRGEARRGEARRGEARRGWKTAKTARPANCTHTRARTLALSCFGPATINERRAKIVLCFHPPILSSQPISALHLPVRRLAFTGMGSIRRLSGFLRAGQDLSINILEPIRGNRGANLMPKETVSDDSLYR